MSIKLIIFDVGGVMSSEKRKMDPFLHVAQKYGIDREKLDVIFYKYFNDYHFNKTLSQYNFWKCVLGELNKNVFEEEIEETIKLFNENVLCDASKNVLMLLKTLSHKYKLVLLSNSFRDMDKAIFSSNYIKYFDRICLTHLNSKKKPLEEAYLESIEGFGFKPEECLLVDDKLRNVHGAEKVGMKGIVYTTFADLMIELKKRGVT